MFKLGSFLTVLFISLKSLANPACPVCMVTVGASLYIAEKSGLDKCVIGVWSGALLAIFGYFLLRWMNKKKWFFAGRNQIITAAKAHRAHLREGAVDFPKTQISCSFRIAIFRRISYNNENMFD